MNLLAGPRLKLRVAHEVLGELEARINEFASQPDVYEVVPLTDQETGDHLLKARVRKEPDEKLGIHAGLAAHLLRSALDNLAYGFAQMNPAVNEPHARTGFPVCDSEEGWKRATTSSAKRRGALTDVEQKHWTLFREAQPFSGSNGNRSDPLWLLHRLNIIDKHHAVTLAATSLARMRINLSPASMTFRPFVVHRFQLVDGAEIMRAKAPIETLPKHRIEICFGSGTEAFLGKPVLPALRAMERRVTEIIESFATPRA